VNAKQANPPWLPCFVLFAVGSYDLYKENVYLVALVAAVLMFSGLGAWLWSAQQGKDKK